jgi:hypothetical protein
MINETALPVVHQRLYRSRRCCRLLSQRTGTAGLCVNYSPNMRTFPFEMSDNLPIWVHLNVDMDAERLDRIIRGNNE